MTSKPMSTISYNTEVFLKEKLDLWIEQHILQSYMYICHKGEDGDKDHIHLRVTPNKSLDFMNLSDELKEFDPMHDKPKGVRDWRASKEEDWILYAIHQSQYMKMKYAVDKGEKLPYKWEDIKHSDTIDVEVGFIRAMAALDHLAPSIANRIMSGETPYQLISKGESVFMVNALINSLSHREYNELIEQIRKKDKLIGQFDSFVHSLGYRWEEDSEGKLIFVGEQISMLPIDVRGLCDDPYCPSCGKALNDDDADMPCKWCGCQIDWCRWHKMND